MADARKDIDLSRFSEVLAAKKASTIVCIDWVFNRLGVDPRTLETSDPPSMGALSLLVWANANRDSFFTTIWAKTIPSKSQIEMQEKLRDDGRALTMLANLEESFYAESAEGIAAEPGLPA